MTAALSSIPVITISHAALVEIQREAARSLDGLETGGILLGVDLGEEVNIRHAGGPGPKARRAKG